jgi:hypothetical protein
MRNLKNCIRYVTKEDPRAVINGFDYSLASWIVKAHDNSTVHKKVNWADPSAAQVSLTDRKSLEAYVLNEARVQERCDQLAEMASCTLKPWKTEILELLKCQVGNDRLVTWLHDQAGNSGKTFLSKYMHRHEQATIFTNTVERDVAHAYNKEPIVIFDIARSAEGKDLSFSLIEHLKNGCLFSNKYDSQVKQFSPPPAILVLSNSLPMKSKLSVDRWNVFSLSTYIDNIEFLQRLDCYNKHTDCTNNLHFCNNK